MGWSLRKALGLEEKAIGYGSRSLSLVEADGWMPQTRIASGERVTPQSASGLSATWACVNFWAGNIAALSLSVYRTGADGVAVPDPRHPLHWLLHSSPNYDQSAFDFWEFMVASLELAGNAYAELVRRSDGFLTSLVPIRPDLVTVRRNNNGDLEYDWTEDGKRRKLTQESVLHIRGPFGSPLGGASPLVTLRQVFGTALATEKAAASTFENGMKPSGVLSTHHEVKLTPEQRSTLNEHIDRQMKGSRNFGRPLVLDGGMNWQQINISPEDAQMLESRQFSLEEIARAFEVDPHLIGHVHGNSTLGSSISDQTLSLMKFKMRKRLKRIEGSLEKQLLTKAERDAGLSIAFNVEQFLRADSKGRAEFYDKMRPFMTTNEVRALEGLPPIEGGDTIMAQMQDVPLSRAVEGESNERA